MSTHNIRFYGEITKNIPELSSDSLLMATKMKGTIFIKFVLSVPC